MCINVDDASHMNILTTWHAASDEALLKSSVLRFSKSDSPTAIGTVIVRLGLLMKDIIDSSLLLLTMYLSPLLPTPVKSPLPFFEKFLMVWLGTPFGPKGLWSSSRHLSSPLTFFSFLRQALLQQFLISALTKAIPLWIRPIAICRLFVSASSSFANILSALKELSSRARKRFSTYQIMKLLQVRLSCLFAIVFYKWNIKCKALRHGGLMNWL